MFAADTLRNVRFVDTNGIVTSFELGIEPEDFDIIPPNQDLYCVIQSDPGQIVKLSRTLLTNYWGDLLITQEGAFDFEHPLKLFILSWDAANAVFVVRSISHPNGLFEHVTFAPIDLPSFPE